MVDDGAEHLPRKADVLPCEDSLIGCPTDRRKPCALDQDTTTRKLTTLLLEVMFWTPLWAVPLGVRWVKGKPPFFDHFVVSIYLSSVLGYVGAQLRSFRLVLVYRVLLFVLLFLGALTATGAGLVGIPDVNASIMLAILGTNLSEASEFVRVAVPPYGYLLILALAAPVIPLIIQARRGLFWSPRLRTGAWLLFFLLAQVLVRYGTTPAYTWQRKLQLIKEDFPELTYRPWRYLPLRPYVQSLYAYQLRREIARIASSRKPLEDARFVESTPGAKTYVIVVGESLSRAHMHLYGYPRPTTPWLDGLARAGELWVFNNVAASQPYTGPSLLDALTWTGAGSSDRRPLPDVFNAAGFATYWISNQAVGALDTASFIAYSCARHIWLHSPVSLRVGFDDAILPVLSGVLKDSPQNKVVFVHLMGCHTDYKARYPDSAEYFTSPPVGRCLSAEQARVVNEYDNSVRFNDSVVGGIISQVRESGGEAFVVYFSDHGEEVYDFRHLFLHSDKVLSPYMVEIPFLVWLSDGYRLNHAGFVRGLGAALGRVYVNSNFSYTMADLARLTFPGMDARRSLFSSSYEPTTRVVAERDYDEFRRHWAPDAAHADGIALTTCREE
jgi:heptose-I-phosphate ethanolaminephosphotransferase